VLKHPDFALFWGSQAFSLVGTWMQNFAQGYVVASLTTSAFALGLVNFAASVPTLVLMPLGGVAADRIERRRILIFTQWLMLILAAITGVLLHTHKLQLWHIYLIAVPLGIATAYELPAYQAFVPQLVEKEDLPQAISLNQATFHGSRIIGPAVAGAFVKFWGTAAAFFANSASFFPVIIALMMIKPRPAPPRSTASTASFMAEGFRYVRERPAVMSLLGLTGVTTLFIFPNFAILTPFYVLHTLGLQAGALGTLMSISGAGALLGSAAMLAVPREQRVMRISLCLAAILVTMSMLAWAHGLWLPVVAMTIQSFAISHSLGLASLMIQESVPDELRGRVMSLYSLTFTGIMPFAALLVSKAADWAGMRLELQVSAVLYTIAGLGLMLNLHRALHSQVAQEA
jgi:MFS family permease